MRQKSGHSPGWAVDAETSDSNVRILQVDAVGEQRLHVLIVLRFQLGGGRKVVEVLLDQIGHELLIERQLVVSCYHDLYLVRQGACRERTLKKSVVKTLTMTFNMTIVLFLTCSKPWPQNSVICGWEICGSWQLRLFKDTPLKNFGNR